MNNVTKMRLSGLDVWPVVVKMDRTTRAQWNCITNELTDGEKATIERSFLFVTSITGGTPESMASALRDSPPIMDLTKPPF